MKDEVESDAASYKVPLNRKYGYNENNIESKSPVRLDVILKMFHEILVHELKIDTMNRNNNISDSAVINDTYCNLAWTKIKID